MSGVDFLIEIRNKVTGLSVTCRNLREIAEHLKDKVEADWEGWRHLGPLPVLEEPAPAAEEIPAEGGSLISDAVALDAMNAAATLTTPHDGTGAAEELPQEVPPAPEGEQASLTTPEPAIDNSGACEVVNPQGEQAAPADDQADTPAQP